jgi:hypothetical protein
MDPAGVGLRILEVPEILHTFNPDLSTETLTF